MKRTLTSCFFFFITTVATVTSGFVFAETATGSEQAIPIKVRLENGDYKTVRLPKISLSKDRRARLSTNIAAVMAHPVRMNFLKSSGPSSVENGMNQLLVLDQGVWGTCATFAATAAVDALLGLKEMQQTSQLCNLQLGRTLHLPDASGGWDGSSGYLVLRQLMRYGYISLDYQTTAGCGGLTQYPVRSYNNGVPMAVSEFSAHSVLSFTKADWRPILFGRDFAPMDPADGDVTLNEVKHVLVSGNRVLFGVLLDVSNDDPGAVGRYHEASEDVWVLTKEASEHIESGYGVAGHELVITGYDDGACATYQDEKHQTQQQCGLLHLRNSWSEWAGDHGDYYMTYDYFKTMAVEAYAIGKNIRLAGNSLN